MNHSLAAVVYAVMTTELRKTGIALAPEIPWGTHLCLFYETSRDLLEVVTPYVKGGLENNEQCVVMPCEHISRDEVMHALREAVPDLDCYERRHALEVVGAEDFCLENGVFQREKAERSLREKLDTALGRGFDGLRIIGDDAWLDAEQWRAFSDYERAVGNAIAGWKIIVMCAYPLGERGAAEILDVARAHEFVIARRNDVWDVLETSALKQTKTELGRRYRTVFEVSHDVLIFHDQAQNIVDINPRGAQITGYTLSELRRMSAPRDLVVPEQSDMARDILDQVRKGEVKQYEIRWKTKDGRIVELDGVTVPFLVPGQNDVWTFCTMRDITRRKQIERDLRESEKRFEKIFRTSPVVAMITRLADGRLIDVNDTFAGMFGYSRAEAIGRSALELNLWADPANRLLLMTELEKTGSVQGYEARARTKASRIVDLVVSIERIDIAGEQCLMICAFDQTARKGAEDALRRASEELKALSRRLVAVQETERRKLSRELHDRIGQNLTALGINLDIVKTRLITQDREITTRLEDSRALLEATSDATIDLLSGLRPPMLDDVGLLSALEWYGRDFSERTGIEVSVVGEDRERRLDAESEIVLFRIAQEALNNVAKHARARHVDVELMLPNGEWILSISDDGVGVDTKAAESRRAAGGLGIATMRERALALGARFEMQARLGGGTSVVVRVPAK